jgi:hypothetical protein
MDLRTRIKSLSNWLFGHRDRAAWVLLALVLIGVVALANPMKLLVGAWLGAKIIASALIGVALFHTWDDPHVAQLEGIERAMAYTRRVTLMAAAIIAAAFAP